MNVVCIVQARMTSTRLPGKVLKEVLGKPLLEYEIERLQQCRSLNKIVVATTVLPSDDAVVTLCDKLGVNVFRGSEEDVLSRYAQAAKIYQADVVVRVTADCPLIDPAVVDLVVQTYLGSEGKYDYVSNTLERTYPRGLDVEVFSAKALQLAQANSVNKEEREHVTVYIYRRPQEFSVYQVKEGTDNSNQRWTVDTPEDFQLIEKILQALYPDNRQFSMQDVLGFLRENPQLMALNAHIEQKEVKR